MIFVFRVCSKPIFSGHNKSKRGTTKVREAQQKLERHNKIGGSTRECLCVATRLARATDDYVVLIIVFNCKPEDNTRRHEKPNLAWWRQLQPTDS